MYVDLSFGLVYLSGMVVGAVGVGRDCSDWCESERALRAQIAALDERCIMSNDMPGRQGRFLATGGFEVPLEMLYACHGRIAQQCETLRRLAKHLASQGTDEDARGAAASVIRYFDSAAKHHHEDEEKDLFPALIESMAGSDPVCLREMTQGLAAEHRELEARWRHLRDKLERVAAGDPVQLRSEDVQALVGLYETHMKREEQELLPMAERLLSDEELERMGRSMRERRGIQLAE